MITLISKWKLRNGCPPELVSALNALGKRIAAEEPGTLIYLVNLNAQYPLSGSGQPLAPPAPAIPCELQTDVTFLEAYESPAAFATHLNGEIFTGFRKKYLGYFYEDPTNPGWANTETTFLQREVTVVR